MKEQKYSKYKYLTILYSLSLYTPQSDYCFQLIIKYVSNEEIIFFIICFIMIIIIIYNLSVEKNWKDRFKDQKETLAHKLSFPV